MISDILSDAHGDIKSYLDNPNFKTTYSDPHTLDKINAVLVHMDAVRAYLDRPPEQSINEIEKHIKFSANYGIGTDKAKDIKGCLQGFQYAAGVYNARKAIKDLLE